MADLFPESEAGNKYIVVDGMNRQIIRNMLETLFSFTGIEILMLESGMATSQRSVECFFYQTSQCKNGMQSSCRRGTDINVGSEMKIVRD